MTTGLPGHQSWQFWVRGELSSLCLWRWNTTGITQNLQYIWLLNFSLTNGFSYHLQTEHTKLWTWWHTVTELAVGSTSTIEYCTEGVGPGAEFNRVTGIHCVHYIEQNDCTAGLDARGISEIPNTKVNQVYSSYTGRTVQGRSALSVLTL